MEHLVFDKALPTGRSALVYKVLSGVVACCLILTILGDRLSSSFQGQAFYLSESALFSSIWLFFIPILLVQSWLIRWFKKPLKAGGAFLSVLGAIAGHVLVYSVFVYGLSWLLFDHTYTVLKTIHYTLGEDLAKYGVIYGAAGLYAFRQAPVSPPMPVRPLTTLQVTSGKHTRIIQVEEIIFLSASSPYVVIHTREGNYLYQMTLKELGKSLPSPPFLQIHKSHLINLSHVKSYQSRLNGDYDVLMKNGAALRLSRTYAVRFKQAFV